MKKILYVDDDPDDRLFLSEAIQMASRGVEVVESENGLKAIEYLEKLISNKEQLPCLIVLDINMPFLDGRETFSRIRKELALHTIPVIVFSSSEKPEDKNQFNQMGVEYLVKPYEIEQLNQIAGHMVEVCSSC